MGVWQGWLAGSKADLAAAERHFMEVVHSYFFCLSAYDLGLLNTVT